MRLSLDCALQASHDGAGMTTQEWMWIGDIAALALALFAGVADWRRTRRRNLDDSGWVPWRGIQIAAIFAAIAFTVLAMRG